MLNKFLFLLAVVSGLSAQGVGSILKNLKYEATATGGVSISAIKSAAAAEINTNLANSGSTISPTGTLTGWVIHEKWGMGLSASYLRTFKNNDAGNSAAPFAGRSGNFAFAYIPVEIYLRYEIWKNLQFGVGGGVGINMSSATVTYYSGQSTALTFKGVAGIASVLVGYRYPLAQALVLEAQLQFQYIFDRGFDSTAAGFLFGSAGDLSANTLLVVPRVGVSYRFN